MISGAVYSIHQLAQDARDLSHERNALVSEAEHECMLYSCSGSIMCTEQLYRIVCSPERTPGRTLRKAQRENIN